MDDSFWLNLQEKYAREGAGTWGAESEAIRRQFDEIMDQLQGLYSPDKPLNVGGGGIAIRLLDLRLSSNEESVFAVLKMPRPVAGQAVAVNEILQRETERLRGLRHQNVIRILTYGTTPSNVHYYVMEHLDAPLDADEYLVSNPTIESLLQVLTSAAEGLNYMHLSGLAHLDVKPANIFVAAGGKSVVVADLGFAKKVEVEGVTRYLGGTAGYKHPEHDHLIRTASLSQLDLADPNRELRRDEVSTEKIRAIWDVYSFGVTTLILLRVLELANPHITERYEYRYVKLMAHRMIGRNLVFAVGATEAIHKYGRRDETRTALINERYLGLRADAFAQLEYVSMQDILTDLAKMVGTFDVLRIVPELSTHPENVIQAASHGAVPFTDRVRRLVDADEVRALGRVDQLGLVRLVYPSASHSRLEHSLGTLSMAARFARALLNDPLSPLFRQLMTAADMDRLLAICLVHDIGHYALAHDLEEVDREIFGHEKRTQHLLERTGSRVAQILRSDAWNVDIDTLTAILESDRRTPLPLKDMIIKSIIDGPIDADKLDYLLRDSENLRLPYGAGVDVRKLMQCLTVVVNDVGSGSEARIGIHDKGRIPAESVAFARYAMYGSVYWHRTHRTMKAMLNRIGFEVLYHQSNSGGRWREKLRTELYAFLAAEEVGQLTLEIADPDQQRWASPYLDSATQRIVWWLVECLPRTSGYVELAEDLLFRRLYKRVLVISRNRGADRRQDWQRVEQVFGRIGRNWHLRREVSIEVQKRIALAVASWDGRSTSGSSSISSSDQEAFQVAAATRPVILVDYPPVKSGSNLGLEYLREVEWSEDRRGGLRVDQLEASSMWNALVEQYSVGLGKVRVYVHPQFATAVRSCVPRETLELAFWGAIREVRE
jgi:HD superfamily phosphohydrolase